MRLAICICLFAFPIAACGSNKQSSSSPPQSHEIKYTVTGGPTGIQDALTIHPDLSVTITHKDSSCTTSISAQDATILQREIESTKGPITTLPTVKPSSDSVQTSIAYDGNPVSLFGNQVTDVINRLQSLLYGGCSTR